MQVPSTFLNPFMSWQMLCVHLHSRSGLWKVGPVSSPACVPVSENLDNHLLDELSLISRTVVFKLWHEWECRFPVFSLLIWNLESQEEDVCVFIQLQGKRLKHVSGALGSLLNNYYSQNPVYLDKAVQWPILALVHLPSIHIPPWLDATRVSKPKHLLVDVLDAPLCLPGHLSCACSSASYQRAENPVRSQDTMIFIYLFYIQMSVPNALQIPVPTFAWDPSTTQKSSLPLGPLSYAPEPVFTVFNVFRSSLLYSPLSLWRTATEENTRHQSNGYSVLPDSRLLP